MSNLAPALLSALAILQAGPATTPPPNPSEGNTVESLVVTAPAKTDKEQITSFVSSVTATGSDKRVGRWDRKICPGVIGLKPAYAQVLLDRIAANAQAVGLEVGKPGCKADILIVASADTDALVRQAVKDNPDTFAKYEDGVSRGKKALQAFIDSQAPVRWWHVSSRKLSDGQTYVQGANVRVRSVGRVNANTRVDFDHVVIVLDARRVGVVRFSALADYVAMVSLAQINPDADTKGVSSILNLFTDKAAGVEPVEGMTDWDRAYLRGLYTARRDVRRGDRQEADVARSMGTTLAPPPKPEPKDEAEPKSEREKPDRSGR
ncbi:hypothetical protein QO010_001049 [Caulobacter ginsengisoli]|uniref:Uncharacterized protein n=1 Tax=Caulobacter ginsengisoli TaxID=400775 RepID=A0ABU0IMR2_9CAUL|nr:hypothetical protein [Caulobacter ginsengisoli]MDQ0463301.1 hypothetical protein [Caulobacter ginsengisoli]